MVRFSGVFVLLVVGAALTAHAGSVLEVNVSDGYGHAEGQVLYSIWDHEEDDYVHLHSRQLLRGSDRIALAPGNYAIHIVYSGTRPEQYATMTDIEVGQGEEIVRNFYFGRGEAVFRARDSKWNWNADTDIFLYRFDEDAEEFELLHSRPLSYRRRQTGIDLAPGTYRVRIEYKETMPRSESVEVEFDITDGEELSVLALFQQGPMPIRRKHSPLDRRGSSPALVPNEALTRYTDNKG